MYMSILVTASLPRLYFNVTIFFFFSLSFFLVFPFNVFLLFDYKHLRPKDFVQLMYDYVQIDFLFVLQMHLWKTW